MSGRCLEGVWKVSGGLEIFGSKNSKDQKNNCAIFWGAQTRFEPKIFRVLIFWGLIFFGLNIFSSSFLTEIFGPKTFLDPKIFGAKILFTQNFFQTKNYLLQVQKRCLNHFLEHSDPNFFGVRIVSILSFLSLSFWT